jgi:hypothetical protein
MASGTFYPAAGGDDGYVLGSSFFYAAVNYANIGNLTNHPDQAAFVRFVLLNIPQGATITKAEVTFQAYSSYSNTIATKCHFEAADNPAAPISAANYQARTLTTGTAFSPEAWTAGSSYKSPDIKAELQEVINRPGWAEDNAVLFAVENNGTAYGDGTYGRQFYCYDYSGGSKKAALYVEWSAPEVVEVPVTELLLTAHAPLIIPVKVGATGLILEALSPTCGIVIAAPASGLILTGYVPSLGMAVNIPLTELSLAVPAFHAGYISEVEAKSLLLSAMNPGLAMGVPMPVAGLEIASFRPQYRWDIPATERTVAQGIYLCYLTGENESPPLEDLLIKISSFQSRLRDGDPSYVSVVVPGADDYVDDILARQNGEIVIKKGYRLSDGTIMAEEIARAAFESLQTFEGAHSYSATLTGHATTSSSSPADRTVTGLSYLGRLVSGKTTIRADMDLFLRVGDVCIYGSEAAERFTVGQISYTVGPYQAIMQVTEA